MYGLPKNVDLSFFVGRTLLQVCFGAHDLILHFDGEVSVTVTSAVGVADHDCDVKQYDDFRKAAPDVLLFLDRVVQAARGEEDGRLVLVFEGGGSLFVYDDSKHYESYTISNRGRVIVV